MTTRLSARFGSPLVAASMIVASTIGFDQWPQAADTVTMDTIAQSYVQLVLAVGQHDADYVDAYYGPPEWKTAAERTKRPLGDIRRQADGLLVRLGSRPPQGGDDLERLRDHYLTTSEKIRCAPTSWRRAAGSIALAGDGRLRTTARVAATAVGPAMSRTEKLRP